MLRMAVAPEPGVARMVAGRPLSVLIGVADNEHVVEARRRLLGDELACGRLVLAGLAATGRGRPGPGR